MSKFPDLAGISEVAEHLGVSRQRASQLQHLPHFPAPVARLRSGPVWKLSDIVEFESKWDRLPGRPMKQEDQQVMEHDDVQDTPLSATDRAALTQMLDTFLATGATRSIVPMSEVQNLALDMRLILNPVVRDVVPSLT